VAHNAHVPGGSRIVPKEVEIGSTRLTAFHNVVTFINANIVLPQQVFSGIWDRFFFFESDRVFAASFVGIISDFIRAEQAKACCLLNFTQTRALEYQEAAAIYLEETMSESEYASRLRAGGPAEGWFFSIDRYGCGSDKGGDWRLSGSTSTN
jgi:hypothetical protein